MSAYSTEQIRNIVIAGHAGSGKTTLLESLLAEAGTINAKGSVEQGNTVADYDPLEQRHRHSLAAAVASAEHGGCHLNFIDTPGSPDFIGNALSALAAVETACIVVSGANGVETVTRRLMDIAGQQKLCRMVVINHIGADGVDIEAVLNSVKENFGDECLPLNLPAGGGSRVVDCFFNPDGESDFYSVSEAHTEILDQTVEVDDELMTLYLEDGEAPPERLHDAFEKALREGHLIPVCFVSAQTGAGIPELLDVFAKLMPNPLEGNPPEFVNGEGEEAEPIQLSADPDKHLVAHVFKVEHDPFVGKIGVFRIHQGTVRKDSQVFVGDARKPIKFSNLFELCGKQHTDVGDGIPGDIRAIAKVDEIVYDAVLHDSHEEDSLHRVPVSMPQPMVGVAVEPSSRGEEQKVSEALAKLAAEDPCFRIERDPSANETVLRGLGDLHLRVALERMQERYNVEVKTHPPTIPYRETIMQPAEGHCRHKKQTGGAGQFGEVFLRVEPLPRGEGFEFVDEIVGGVIPSQFIPAVEKGVRQVLDSGAFAGFPLQDIRVTVYDGKHHSVDSKEIAFVTAGRKAFIDAVMKAKPTVLEPIVEVEVTAPGSSVGDITGDLSQRRGRIANTDAAGGAEVRVLGQVPLAEMEDYQSRLKSLTGGEGDYALSFAGYEPAPAALQQQLMANFQHAPDD